MVRLDQLFRQPSPVMRQAHFQKWVSEGLMATSLNHSIFVALDRVLCVLSAVVFIGLQAPSHEKNSCGSRTDGLI